jgi:hypothetical protein
MTITHGDDIPTISVASLPTTDGSPRDNLLEGRVHA